MDEYKYEYAVLFYDSVDEWCDNLNKLLTKNFQFH